MASLLENMIHKAHKDGQAERLRDALNTAIAVKMDCEQRFQDDTGIANNNMCAMLSSSRYCTCSGCGAMRTLACSAPDVVLRLHNVL